jgi:hypothetical protein
LSFISPCPRRFDACSDAGDDHLLNPLELGRYPGGYPVQGPAGFIQANLEIVGL